MNYIALFFCFYLGSLQSTEQFTKRTLDFFVAPFAKQYKNAPPAKRKKLYREKITFIFSNGYEFSVYDAVSKTLRTRENCVAKEMSEEFKDPKLTIDVPLKTTSNFIAHTVRALVANKELEILEWIIQHPQYTYNQKIKWLIEVEGFFHYLGGYEHIGCYLHNHMIMQPNKLLQTDLLSGNEKDFDWLISQAMKEVQAQQPNNANITDKLLREILLAKLDNLFKTSAQYVLKDFAKRLFIQLMKTTKIHIIWASLQLQTVKYHKNRDATLSFLEYQLNKLTELYDLNSLIQFTRTLKFLDNAPNLMIDTNQGIKNFNYVRTSYTVSENNKNNKFFKDLIILPETVTKFFFNDLAVIDRITNRELIAQKLIE